jgi:hypothetical protein
LTEPIQRVTVDTMAVRSDEVEIVPGVVGPRVVSNELFLPAMGGHGVFTLRFSASFDEADRRYACDEIHLSREPGARPITTEVLRQFALGEVVQGFLRTLLLIDRSDDPSVATEDRQDLQDLPNPDGREPWGSRVPEGVAAEGGTDRALAWVAHFYRLGIAVGDQPTKWVQDNFGFTRTTAIRRVMAARDRGFLGEAEVGKAGERPPKVKP